jgi:hypothetical protein
MARYDVYENANRATAREYPLLVDVQADYFRDLRTRIVVPLAPREALGSFVASLAGESATIVGAIDFLLTGF